LRNPTSFCTIHRRLLTSLPHILSLNFEFPSQIPKYLFLKRSQKLGFILMSFDYNSKFSLENFKPFDSNSNLLTQM
jgi:hypothetical protein